MNGIELDRTNSNEEIVDVGVDLSGNYDCPRCGAMNCPLGIYIYYKDEPYGMRYCSSPTCCLLMEPTELAATLQKLAHQAKPEDVEQEDTSCEGWPNFWPSTRATHQREGTE